MADTYNSNFSKRKKIIKDAPSAEISKIKKKQASLTGCSTILE